MSRPELTPRQGEILALIQRHIDERGYPPTRAEIADELGFRSANAAEDHLRAIANKGYIELFPGLSRGVRIVEPSGKAAKKGGGRRSAAKRGAGNMQIPLVGRVAAGRPLLAEENIESRYTVDPWLFRPRADYLLRVEGMSMCDAGILDGDLLAVHRTPDVENRQIVVARLEDEVTVKRWRRRRNSYRVHLVPENPDFEPIVVDLRETDLVVEGLCVGVIRRGVDL